MENQQNLIIVVGGLSAFAAIVVLTLVVIFQQQTIKGKDRSIEATVKSVTELWSQLPLQLKDLSENLAVSVVPVEQWQKLWESLEKKASSGVDFFKAFTPDQVDKLLDKGLDGFNKLVAFLSSLSDGKPNDPAVEINIDDVARRAAAHVLDMQSKAGAAAAAPAKEWSGGILGDSAPKTEQPQS